jgi:hypothetical protein
VNKLYDEDFEHHKKLAQANVPNFGKYDTSGQGAFIDLTFNMGGAWPKKFKNTAKKIEEGDTYGAARGLEDSKWYKQVASRGPEIVGLVENAKISAAKGGLTQGPLSGYPAMLHGREMITPLKPDSILEKLASTSQAAASNESSISLSKMENMMRNVSEINSKNSAEWIAKLDKVINILETTHNTQEKLLRVART